MEQPMEPRIIKTDQQYRRFLAEVETLAAADPDPEAANGARLELLAKLVEDYEKARFPFEKDFRAKFFQRSFGEIVDTHRHST